MVGLLHYFTFVPGSASVLADRLAGPIADWLPGSAIDDDRVVVAMRPDGLLPNPDSTLAVTVAVGPSIRTRSSLLRRLSFSVGEDVPTVRCDLELTPCRSDGARLRVRGDYRPPLGSKEAADVHETVEAVVRPLVDGIAERLQATTLTM